MRTAAAAAVTVLLVLSVCGPQRCAADRGGQPAKRTAAKRHGPCRPDDARCIALRDHVCDPYYQQVSDKYVNRVASSRGCCCMLP